MTRDEELSAAEERVQVATNTSHEALHKIDRSGRLLVALVVVFLTVTLAAVVMFGTVSIARQEAQQRRAISLAQEVLTIQKQSHQTGLENHEVLTIIQNLTSKAAEQSNAKELKSLLACVWEMDIAAVNHQPSPGCI